MKKHTCCPNKCDLTGPELLEVAGLVTIPRRKTLAEQRDELAVRGLLSVDEPPICWPIGPGR